MPSFESAPYSLKGVAVEHCQIRLTDFMAMKVFEIEFPQFFRSARPVANTQSCIVEQVRLFNFLFKVPEFLEVLANVEGDQLWGSSMVVNFRAKNRSPKQPEKSLQKFSRQIDCIYHPSTIPSLVRSRLSGHRMK